MSCRRLTHKLGLLGWLLWGIGSLAGTHPVTAWASPPPDLSQLLRGVENRYNRMKSMQAQFEQILRQGSQAARQERGVLYLSKPGRMRWEYENPEPKLFLTDGKRAILFLPEENRVMESAIRETDDLRAPLAFLLGRLDFDEQFGRYETSPDLKPLEAGDSVFRTFPKKMGERIEWVRFEIGPQYEIHRIVVREIGGIETDFRFEQERANPALAASLFQFQPPAGAEVVRE